ncbi:MAG: ABC transporter ATP-binding protein [Microbacterium sp.]
MNVITAEAVAKSFRGRPLYTDATFTIPAGTITGVAGPNGSGKSVLFRLLCGFDRPDRGTITIEPRYLSARRTFPERFGVLIDRPGYIGGATGLENLLALARIRRVIDEEKVTQTMSRLGLDPSLTQKVRHYSLGMKQKLALAQAIMEDPEVLLLDEPFNALDEDSVAVVKDLIRDFHAAGGTLVFTSHNPADIPELATRVLTIGDGRVTSEERPEPRTPTARPSPPSGRRPPHTGE